MWDGVAGSGDWLPACPVDERSGFNPSLHAKTPAFDDNGIGMMQQPIQNGRGQGAIVVEHLGPLLEGPVRGHDGCPLFIAQADDLEKQVRAGFVYGQVSELVT